MWAASLITVFSALCSTLHATPTPDSLPPPPALHTAHVLPSHPPTPPTSPAGATNTDPLPHPHPAGATNTDPLPHPHPARSTPLAILSSNRLASLQSVARFSSVLKLDMSCNSIAVLPARDSSIWEGLPALRILLLHQNLIRDWRQVLGLKGVRSLAVLSLHGNPMCAGANFRRFVVNELPSLLLLDDHVVTDREYMAPVGPASLSWGSGADRGGVGSPTPIGWSGGADGIGVMGGSVGGSTRGNVGGSMYRSMHAGSSTNADADSSTVANAVAGRLLLGTPASHAPLALLGDRPPSDMSLKPRSVQRQQRQQQQQSPSLAARIPSVLIAPTVLTERTAAAAAIAPTMSAAPHLEADAALAAPPLALPSPRTPPTRPPAPRFRPLSHLTHIIMGSIIKGAPTLPPRTTAAAAATTAATAAAFLPPRPTTTVLPQLAPQDGDRHITDLRAQFRAVETRYTHCSPSIAIQRFYRRCRSAQWLKARRRVKVVAAQRVQRIVRTFLESLLFKRELRRILCLRGAEHLLVETAGPVDTSAVATIQRWWRARRQLHLLLGAALVLVRVVRGYLGRKEYMARRLEATGVTVLYFESADRDLMTRVITESVEDAEESGSVVTDPSAGLSGTFTVRPVRGMLSNVVDVVSAETMFTFTETDIELQRTPSHAPSHYRSHSSSGAATTTHDDSSAHRIFPSLWSATPLAMSGRGAGHVDGGATTRKATRGGAHRATSYQRPRGASCASFGDNDGRSHGGVPCSIKSHGMRTVLARRPHKRQRSEMGVSGMHSALLGDPPFKDTGGPSNPSDPSDPSGHVVGSAVMHPGPVTARASSANSTNGNMARWV